MTENREALDKLSRAAADLERAQAERSQAQFETSQVVSKLTQAGQIEKDIRMLRDDLNHTMLELSRTKEHLERSNLELRDTKALLATHEEANLTLRAELADKRTECSVLSNDLVQTKHELIRVLSSVELHATSSQSPEAVNGAGEQLADPGGGGWQHHNVIDASRERERAAPPFQDGDDMNRTILIEQSEQLPDSGFSSPLQLRLPDYEIANMTYHTIDTPSRTPLSPSRVYGSRGFSPVRQQGSSAQPFTGRPGDAAGRPQRQSVATQHAVVGHTRTVMPVATYPYSQPPPPPPASIYDSPHHSLRNSFTSLRLAMTPQEMLNAGLNTQQEVGV